MNENTSEKPCLVEAGRGFSVFYRQRFLYSKYAPDRAINGIIENLTILPGTLIIAASPCLWLGLDSLLKKLPEDCFILGVETDKNLYELANEYLTREKEKKASSALPENDIFSSTALLPFSENDYIVNILCGEKTVEGFKIPHISTFRRAIMLEMSAGTQFDKDSYAKLASLSQNTIASFWKNRITLTRLGRLYSRNLFKNLANLPSSVDFRSIAHTVERPLFVFGAGESSEKTIKRFGKEKLEKCFVICVDAAVPSLKSYGIRIDAVAAVEGQLAIEKAYIGGGAKKALLIADILSRPAVTRHTDCAITFFTSKYTDAEFLNNLSKMDFFPPFVPPLGSVGLTATFIALLLRKNTEIPVYLSGLDFSFSLGRTHAKNTPAHIARLLQADRFSPVENYGAAFRNGAKKVCGKNGIEVYTDTALENYAKSFQDAFWNTTNLFDAGEQGIEITGNKLQINASVDEEGFTGGQNGENFTFDDEFSVCSNADSIKSYLEGEEKALNRIKELLMFGKDVASCSMSLDDELFSLISVREYLFLHFPDGYKCKTSDLSFLKRVRSQIDFFLKDIKSALKNLSK